MTKHLYIHIPFCKNICTYCDFRRIQTSNFELVKKYCDDIINQLKFSSFKNQYSTIYIGGGTPNYIPNEILDYFLNEIKYFLNINIDYEFTIECNPEFLTISQAEIFAKNFINRVSIGAQILNPKILKIINRKHSIDDIKNAIHNCRLNNINNINLDFIYNLPYMKNLDIDNIIEFIKSNKIPHISFYALELKENSILTRKKHVLNELLDEEQFFYIKESLEKIGYKRYEISNWSMEEKYNSKHNMAYWLSESWKGIGDGAHGFENNIIYKINMNKNKYDIELEKLNKKDYYFQILMMGLRIIDGINLNIPKYNNAYIYFKNKIKNCIIVNNKLKCNNIDLLDDILIGLLD